MSAFLRAVAAQAAVETRMRLRAPATLVAVVALGVAAVLWIPDPNGRATSLAWKLADGRSFASTYTSAYLSWAAAISSSIWLSLAGFYLVAGSIRRDRERGVGAILAATPLPDTAYLAGKAAAHLLYLGVLSLVTVGAAVVAYLRWGLGGFHPLDFAFTWALFILPALVVTAGCAVLFDVVPGLRSRAGLVAWFFLFVALSSGLNARDEKGRVVRIPRVDPIGMATLEGAVARSLPDATSISTGFIFHDTPFVRVAWPGPVLMPSEVVGRGVSLLAALLPLGVSLFFFDRFDPARAARRRARGSASAPVLDAGEAPSAAAVLAAGVAPKPSAVRAVRAEVRLAWDASPRLAGLVAVAALGAPFLPSGAFAYGAAAALLLLAVFVAEIAAREDAAGTRGLVYAQPGVPDSPVLWKAAAILILVLAGGLPSAARAFVEGPSLGAAFLVGLLFTAGTAAGFGALTGGGKLFLGVYTAVWYLAVSRLPIADFTGLFSGPSAPRAAAFLLAGGAAVALARVREIRAAA